MLEYTAHAAVAEVRSLVTPVAAQTVSVSRGVESHSSLAPIAARRAHETLNALRVAVATELVVAVRALRLAGQEPVGAGTRSALAAVSERLNPDLERPPAAPRRRGRPPADRGLGVRAGLILPLGRSSRVEPIRVAASPDVPNPLARIEGGGGTTPQSTVGRP